MVHKIIFKKRFHNKLQKLLSYIENEFGLLVAQKFAKQLDEKLMMLQQQQPFIGQASVRIKNTRSIIAGKNNRLYYRIESNKIIVLNIFDTRINPKKNKFR